MSDSIVEGAPVADAGAEGSQEGIFIAYVQHLLVLLDTTRT